MFCPKTKSPKCKHTCSRYYFLNEVGRAKEAFERWGERRKQPPDFDPANPYKDPVAFFEMREHLVREKWIDIETSKIIRDKLRWCYRIEGVNHLQKCRHLVEQYLDSTRGIGWGKDGRHPDQHGPKVQSVE